MSQLFCSRKHPRTRSQSPQAPAICLPSQAFVPSIFSLPTLFPTIETAIDGIQQHFRSDLAINEGCLCRLGDDFYSVRLRQLHKDTAEITWSSASVRWRSAAPWPRWLTRGACMGRRPDGNTARQLVGDTQTCLLANDISMDAFAAIYLSFKLDEICIEG